MAFIERTYKVGILHIDKNAILTKKAILGFFETTACEHSDMAGYGISNIPKTNLSWVLLQWKASFIKEVSYGSNVRVITWARDTDAFTSYRDFKLYDESGNLCAIATSKWALIDLTKGLTRIGNIITDNYNPESDCVFSERLLAKIVPPNEKECERVFEYSVMAHDIDVNNHMHNLNYLHLATDALGDDSSFNCVEILYKTQCKQGDLLSVMKTKTEEGTFVVIKTQEKLSAVIKFYN